jgi:hypothetical protein
MWSVLIAAVVIAVAFAGGGWYFAGQIRSSALAAEPAGALPAYDDVKIVAVSGGRIQLRAIGNQPGLTERELIGMAWRGGTGHLGAAEKASGGLVTRPLTVVTGSAPSPGQLAALDRPTSSAIRGQLWASRCATSS